MDFPRNRQARSCQPPRGDGWPPARPMMQWWCRGGIIAMSPNSHGGDPKWLVYPGINGESAKKWMVDHLENPVDDCFDGMRGLWADLCGVMSVTLGKRLGDFGDIREKSQQDEITGGRWLVRWWTTEIFRINLPLPSSQGSRHHPTTTGICHWGMNC